MHSEQNSEVSETQRPRAEKTRSRARRKTRAQNRQKTHPVKLGVRDERILRALEDHSAGGSEGPIAAGERSHVRLEEDGRRVRDRHADQLVALPTTIAAAVSNPNTRPRASKRSLRLTTTGLS